MLNMGQLHSGGVSAVRDPGDFEVRKSSSQLPGVRGVARIVYWGPQKLSAEGA